MSELRTNRIVPRDGLTSGTGVGGGIIQVKSTTKTDAFSDSSTNFVDVTGLSVSITPTRSDSKILVLCSVNLNSNKENFAYLKLVRDSTDIFVGDAAGTRVRVSGMYYVGTSSGNEGICETVSITHMDAPSTTSATTYKIQVQAYSGGAVYVNRTHRDTNGDGYDGRFASSITVMEVSG